MKTILQPAIVSSEWLTHGRPIIKQNRSKGMPTHQTVSNFRKNNISGGNKNGNSSGKRTKKARQRPGMVVGC
jgi:hypothetical protein